MLIATDSDVTRAVLAEAARAPDARTRELLAAGIRHLHGFVRDARLTENEFRNLCLLIARLGQLTNESHNEVMLAAGSLGVSALVCLLNNGGEGQPTTANLMGPFWRDGAPQMTNGESIVRSPTPGVPVFVTAWVHDALGEPLAGARVDVWHASPEGFYENQDPAQAPMNLRGTFTSDAAGRIALRTVKPAGYPVPVNGPVGDLLRAQGRHNLRPAHLHFMIKAEGHETLVTHLFREGDPYLDSDVVFGVRNSLIVQMPENPAKPGRHMLHHDFVLNPRH